MTDFASETSIGARIRAARKARGIRTSKELANRILGATVTESIIENIESGRKVNLDVSQLLNIAMAPEVPPIYLLAPIGDPNSPIDLPGPSDAFSGMSAIVFDAWLAGLTGLRPRTAAERNARLELEALREVAALDAEIERLGVAIEVERETPSSRGYSPGETFLNRLDLAKTERSKLLDYLRSAGWNGIRNDRHRRAEGAHGGSRQKSDP